MDTAQETKENSTPPEKKTAPSSKHASHKHGENEVHEVKTLLSWEAPGRPFRERGKEYFASSMLLMLLIEVVLFLFQQHMLMLVVLSLVFVAYALATTPPTSFKYRISTEGLTIEDHFYLWQELYDFYFKKRDKIDTVHIRTLDLIPGELIIPLGTIEKEKVQSILVQYLPYREVIRPTFIEKSGDWLSRTFPLEKNSPS
jgi:hypothetical protein